MNLQEAYKTLELKQSSSPEEIKQKYKELAKKYHPDINKDPNSTNKLKEINAAYDTLKSYNESPANFLNNIREQRIPEHIHLEATISFKESVLGVHHKIKFSRQAKCNNCEGNGEVQKNNGCKTCKGRGKIVTTNKNMTFIQTCTSCYGQAETEICKTCQGNTYMNSDVTLDVNIPSGIQDSNILRLAGCGNFAMNFMGMERNTDVFLKINVTPYKNLSLNDQGNVISNLQISLLEALQGTTKSIDTILDERTITIPPKSKNKDEIIIPNLGVNKKDQKVILEVIYPENINSLVEALKDK